MLGALGIQAMKAISFQESSLWTFLFIDSFDGWKKAGQDFSESARYSRMGASSTNEFYGDIMGGMASDAFRSGVAGLKTVNAADTAVISLLTQKINLPFMSFETEADGSTDVKFVSGKTARGDLTVEFLESETFVVSHFLDKWEESIYDRRTHLFKSGNPKKSGILLTFPKGRTISGTSRLLGGSQIYTNLDTLSQDISGSTPNSAWFFSGIMYKGRNDLDFNYETVDPMKISATFSVDDVYPYTIDSLLGSFI